jgi:hypothetical protein
MIALPIMGNPAPKIPLDLSDPESIKRQVPQIEEMVEAKQQIAESAQEDFETWTALLGRLRLLAGLVLRFEMGTERGPSAAEEDAVVRVVEKEDRPIMVFGVASALEEEGHEVEGPHAVEPVMLAAVESGRMKRLDSDWFAPMGLDTSDWNEGVSTMEAVPEAHMGLGPPAPQSKAEGAIRVLASEPERFWTTREVVTTMVEVGWLGDIESNIASMASALSRLHAEKKIFRPRRGRYRLAPPRREGA